MRELAKHNSSTLFIEGANASVNFDKVPSQPSGIHENDAKRSTDCLTSTRLSSRDELCINEYYKRSLNIKREILGDRLKEKKMSLVSNSRPTYQDHTSSGTIS